MGTKLYLYKVEYEVMKTGKTYLCKSVGTSEQDVVFDLFRVIGGVKVEDVTYLSDVHLIKGTVGEEIMVMRRSDQRKNETCLLLPSPTTPHPQRTLKSKDYGLTFPRFDGHT